MCNIHLNICIHIFIFYEMQYIGQAMHTPRSVYKNVSKQEIITFSSCYKIAALFCCYMFWYLLYVCMLDSKKLSYY